MNNKFILNNRSATAGRLFIFILAFVFIFTFASLSVRAHQTPNTIVLFDIRPDGVAAELQLPLGELELAFGNDVTKSPETLVARLGTQLQAYLKAHIHPQAADGRLWSVSIVYMNVAPAEQTYSGPFQEITIRLWMQPPAGANSRNFTLNYDVIMHQVVTHAALVSIRNDWETGIIAEHPVEAGVIRVDTGSNQIYPLKINLEEGSWRNGFSSMVRLGMDHIAAGTDHLLFLLTLLLPAPLLATKKRWGNFGGIRYSIVHLLRVVTAFTVGHSITLLAGVIGWLQFPNQPIEILIAFSILVSAVHAFRPIFPGREVYVAAGFGLIHGMAFAGTLVNLNLAPAYMTLSILGFNIGIELMQLFVIMLTVPWLILLSRTSLYTSFRVTGAVVAAIAALAWMTERILQKTNPLTMLVEKIAAYAPWIIVALACASILSYTIEQQKRRKV